MSPEMIDPLYFYTVNVHPSSSVYGLCLFVLGGVVGYLIREHYRG